MDKIKIILIAGIAGAVVGLGLLIGGIAMNNNLEAELRNLLQGGDGYPGTPMIVIGIVLLVVGLGAGAFGLYKTLKKK